MRTAFASFALVNAGLVCAGIDQTCYYPNGDVAHDAAPCWSNGGVCCPAGWECESNGLCYYDRSDLLGRYSCTEQDWSNSTSCPDMCTHGGAATGNEAVLECGDGQYCCNGAGGPTDNCCTSSSAALFTTYGLTSLGYVATVPVMAATVSKSTTLSSSQSTTVTVQSSPPASSSTIAMIATSGGSVVTVTSLVTSISASSAALPTSSPATSKHSNLATVIGPAVGVPVAFLLICIFAFLLYRRRRQKSRDGSAPPSYRASNLVDMYNDKHNGHTPELDSFPVALKHTRSGKRAELAGQEVVPLTSQAGSFVSPLLPGSPNSSPSLRNHRYSKVSSLEKTPPPRTGGQSPTDFCDPGAAGSAEDVDAAPRHWSNDGTRLPTQYQAYRPPAQQTHPSELMGDVPMNTTGP